MTPILIPREALVQPATWETNGQSPGSSPMAKLQAAQQLIELSQIPGSGIDIYEVARTLIANGPLGNDRNLQKTREQLAAELASAQLSNVVGALAAGGAGKPPSGAAGQGGAGPVGPPL